MVRILFVTSGDPNLATATQSPAGDPKRARLQ